MKKSYVYVYVVLTKNDIQKALTKGINSLWNYFGDLMLPKILGGGTLLFLSIMFLRALQQQEHLPFISIILSVPFALLLLVIAVTILTTKGD
jgi:hypothetical protein